MAKTQEGIILPVGVYPVVCISREDIISLGWSDEEVDRVDLEKLAKDIGEDEYLNETFAMQINNYMENYED